MKKIHIFMIIILLVLSLSACSSSADTTYSIIKNGTSYVVNTENCTISDGSNTYQYSFSGNSSSYNVDITYPDGSTYWFIMSGNSGYGGWSEDYDENRYADGDILREVLIEKAPKESNPGKFIAIIFLLAVGIFHSVSPHTAWYLEYGWRYKDVEPSELALGLNCVGGVVAIIVAIIMIFL